jgi:hypothetical protein
MPRRILTIAVLTLTLLAGASHAFYIGPAFGYSNGLWGSTLYVNLGEWTAIDRNFGLRARVGVAFGPVGGTAFAAGADLTYDFGRVFNPGTPLRLYLAGGPDLGVGTAVAFGVGFGAGLQYDFPGPRIGVFFELKPFGVRFIPTVIYNLFFGTGVNFTL